MDSQQQASSPSVELQSLAATATLSILQNDELSTSTSATSRYAPSVHDDEGDAVTDGKRNWSHDVTLKLLHIWKRVCQERPEVGRVVRMQLVYDAFQETVDCSNRSPKAVEDKLYTIKQMYHFIVKMNGNLIKQGQQKGIPTWFALSKEERRVVRSLHRIRVPNISLESFYVLDSVLNPNPLVAQLDYHQQHQQQLAAQENPVLNTMAPSSSTPRACSVSASLFESATPPLASASATMAGEVTMMISNAEVVDNKRNWTNEVTHQLAKAWHSAVKDNRDLRGAILSQRVYNEFMKVVGGCSRSRKAIEDKMHSMKEMYRFIRMYNTNCVAGSGKPLWFDLSKPDRRQLRTDHKIRVPNLLQEVYEELDTFLSQSCSDIVEQHPLLALPGNALPLLPLQPSALDTSTYPRTATTTNGHGDDAATAAAMFTSSDMAAHNYEVMRRLADEESQLSPLPLHHLPSQHVHQQQQPPLPFEQVQQQQQQQQQTIVDEARHAEENRDSDALDGPHDQPPSKRPRLTTAPANIIDGDVFTRQRLEYLVAIQENAVVERRQQHAEQMALLRDIAQLLRQTYPPQRHI